MSQRPQPLTNTGLASIGGIRHGFFTREGGVSGGIYAGLNCGFGSNDDRGAVAENRARCAAAMGVQPDALVTAYQVHGINVVTVDRPWLPADAPKADAMVTKRRGIALGILTADCGPILFADGEAGVIGAAHAGWKGAKAGVAAATIEAMCALGARKARIVAALGPCIGRASYEVGAEFRDAFLRDDAKAANFFADGPNNRPHFDLGGFVAAQLSTLGIGAIGRVEGDTCADSKRFFSYRRSCLQGEADYGREISTIVLT